MVGWRLGECSQILNAATAAASVAAVLLLCQVLSSQC
jgi:hypothetical protein